MKAEDSGSMAGTTPISSSSPLVPGPDTAAPALLASSASGTDLWIFRDGKKPVSGPTMVRDLQRRISAAAGNSHSLLDALIEAGELEAALADANTPYASTAAKLTD